MTLRCHLEPFDVKETAAFIASRLSAAGVKLNITAVLTLDQVRAIVGDAEHDRLIAQAFDDAWCRTMAKWYCTPKPRPRTYNPNSLSERIRTYQSTQSGASDALRDPRSSGPLVGVEVLGDQGKGDVDGA